MRHIVYERGYEVIEIKILDGSGVVLDKLKAGIRDKKLVNRFFQIIKEKYGLEYRPEISPEESVNAKSNSWINPDA